MSIPRNEYLRNYRETRPEQMAQYRRKWEQEHPEQAKKMHLLATRESNLRIKIEVLAHYGPDGHLRCSWPDCLVTDVDMLSLDHINNDGAADRRNANERGGSNTYWRVRKAGFPEGFQTLCCNHQRKKENLRRREI